jgi:DNA primase
VRWEALEDDGLRPDAFRIRDVPGRLERDGDPWAGIARAAGGLPRLG